MVPSLSLYESFQEKDEKEPLEDERQELDLDEADVGLGDGQVELAKLVVRISGRIIRASDSDRPREVELFGAEGRSSAECRCRRRRR